MKTRHKMSDAEAMNYVRHFIDINAQEPERRALERSWFVDHAYYAGAQNFILDGSRLRNPKIRRGREVFQANMILPKVHKAVSRLIALQVSLHVPPKSGSYEDMQAAKLAELVSRDVDNKTKAQRNLRRVMFQAALYGSGFRKFTFDPQAGAMDRIWKTKNGDVDWDAFFDPEAQKVLEELGQYEDIFQGEIVDDVPSTFQMRWDKSARAEGIAGCAWICQDSYVDIDELKDRYGEEHEFTADEGEHQARLYEDNIASMVSGIPGQNWLSGTGEQRGYGRRARVMEWWERPLARNGNKGRYILIAGNKMITNGDNHYARAGIPLPFVKYDWFWMEGRFIGLGLVQQLRPSQKAYNRSRSHAIEFQNTSGYAPVYLPKGSSVKAVRLTSSPAVIYEYSAEGGVAPQFGQVPRLPEYIVNNAETAKREMDEISAQTAPAKDAFPAGVRSGAAISLLQAENNAVLTPTSQAMLEAEEMSGAIKLQLVNSFYSRPRMLEIAGEFGELDPIEFVNTDLRGHSRVYLIAGPSSMETVEGYRQTILDFIQAGALQPAVDRGHRALIAKALKFGTADEILDDAVRQEVSEQRLIQRMIRERAFMKKPDPWEDPASRMRVLESYLNGREFESLDEDIQKKLALRWEMFRLSMAEQIHGQAMMAESRRGAPGEKGQASQPSQPKAQV
jgi:hypothetical protein